MDAPLASILINNRNYAQFIGEAISSALEQTYSKVEVIVVDDGSTDDSISVIETFGNCIRLLRQAHVGQAAAFNAGVKAAAGEVFFFLDADDICEPTRVEEVMMVFKEADPSLMSSTLIFHPQRYCGANGQPRADAFPPRLVRIGAYRRGVRGESFKAAEMAVISSPSEATRFLRDKHYLPFLTSATSGIAITRPLANRLFPLPEAGITLCADSFVSLGALLEGNVILLNRELSRFRMHGKNRYMISRKRPNADQFFNRRDAYLNKLAARQGLPERVLTLNNWERVYRYLRHKPLGDILVLLTRSETHQYALMLIRRCLSDVFKKLLPFSGRFSSKDAKRRQSAKGPHPVSR